MPSPIHSRDEAAAYSPLRNAFASSSSPKPLHSPFLPRSRRLNGSYTRSVAPSQPDAISTSSSTLVNAESTDGYRPWEVRSESSTSSLGSLASAATPTLQTLDDIGTLPSIHITPLPRRAGRSNGNGSTTRNTESTGRVRPKRQLCPDDCRCSDQDIDLGLCRRVVGSSSSGSDSGSLSVGVHLMTRTGSSSMPAPASELTGTQSHTTNGTQHADNSQQSSHSQSELRSHSQGRDFEKDPVLVPRSARSRSSIGRSPTSPYQRSYDQLQRGLDTLELDESDAESDAEQALAAQRRAESMARWTARRSTLLQSKPPLSRLDSSVEQSPRPTPRSASPEPSEIATPLKATPGRKSIAAVFESMQKEREARAAEEQKQWADKQARRERERAARAFGVLGRRRSSVGSSQMDSPKSVGSSAFATPASVGGTTVFQSMRETPSRSTGGSLASASPMLSSLGSPKVDEEEQPQSPQLSEEPAEGPHPAAIDEVSAEDADPELLEVSPQPEEPHSTPSPQPAPGFAYSPQPMALSPNHSTSTASTPASSPRKNAHRRQASTLSVVARTPARQLDHLIAQESPHTPSGILSSTKKGSVRRGHSVRFSPRPDYRSDSGSWDDSAVLGEEQEGGGLLPAKEIVLPAILAEASTPAFTAAAQEDEEGSREASPTPQTPSPHGVDQQHTPSPPPPKPLPSVEATTSFSHTLHPPGAYASPSKPSRHIIRPSPKITRVLPASLTGPTVPLRGLFANSDSALPRSSTPPPQPRQQTSSAPRSIPDATPSSPMLPPDALRSPRSPRPVDLGLDGFAPFSAGQGSSDDSAGEVVAKMLTTLQRGAQGRREFGARLDEATRQLARVHSSPPPARRAGASRPWDRSGEQGEDEGEEGDRVAQLREEVMTALGVLAERLAARPPPVQNRRLSRGQKLLLVLLQCALIAYLLGLAERKAAHLRMFHPPPTALFPQRGEIDWSTLPTTTLQPLLRLPLLDQLWRSHPPLPARVAEWHAYTAVNGVPPLLAQLALYGVAQTIAGLLLLAMAPLQVISLILLPPNTPS